MLNEMAAFAHVVHYGGFSQAARILGVEPSSVSRSVARLEKSLGAKVLVRNTRSLALTELGSKVYGECEKLLSAARGVADLAGRYSASPMGLLRVSAPVVLGQLWLAPLLARFMAACPDVDLQLSLSDQLVDLIDGQIDVAVRIAAELPQGYAARRLFDVAYLLVASPAYLAAHPGLDHPDQLGAHTCLHLGYGAFGPVWPFRRGEDSAKVTVPSRYAINNSQALCTALEDGAGLGVVPDFTARAALAAGRLVHVFPDWTLDGTYARAVFAIHAAGPQVAPKVRAFVDALAQGARPALR